MITLQSLGWDIFFSNEFTPHKNSGLIPGRISAEHKERYVVLTEHGELQGEVSGKFIYATENTADFPKTGDWVLGTYFEDERKLIIHELLKRKTKFSRNSAGRKNTEQVIASNIDYLFIVQSMDNDFSPRRLERYLATAFEGNISPVIILNKMDLCTDPEKKITQIQNISADIPVIAVSCLNNKGIDEVRKFIREGITLAFVGSSGVGKSTLINILAGKDILKTQEVREADSKGRHTTTTRELFPLAEGGNLIDTPGMREFQLWDADSGIEKVFDEIELLAENCRFSDCTHTKEKDCAVLAALHSGNLSEERYNSYLKLQKELRYLESKLDVNSKLEEKRKWRSIHKELKRFYRNNPGKN